MNHPRTYDSILDVVGQTPLVRLNKIGRGYPVEILAKCEFLNPGGSVKERIAVRMIEEAETKGLLKPGSTLIEATSGNTGIGLAMACAVKGYRLIICMPEKMSAEKQRIMERLGAEIVRTPTDAGHDDPESNFSVAERLQKEIPDAHILDQWTNRANPDAHYYGTGTEILEQAEGRLDYFVAGAGTGGTLTGVGHRLKEHDPKIRIIGADPEGSIIGGGTYVGPYQVEGIGYDFFPDTLDLGVVDRWIKTNDHDSFALSLRLIREEGMLVGGSSGSVMEAALQIARECKGGERIVVLLADNVRNYMSKFIDPVWMIDQNLV
jgi:cystathionine beta-synthase